MWKVIKNIVLLFTIGVLSGCVMPNQYSVLAPGPWRGVLNLEGRKPTAQKRTHPLIRRNEKVVYEEVAGGELPFNFDVFYDDKGEMYFEIINGTERIKVEDITYNRDKATGKRHIRINFPVYESYIDAVYEDQIMEGRWHVPTKGDYSIPFVAKQGKNHRFTTLRKTPKMDLTGKWAASFELDQPKPYPAIGEFQQDGNHLTGTFLTETGDYRFLEGTVQADKAYLSCFDGAHAFLFEAKILEDGTLLGGFWSGNHYKTTWSAKRDANTELANPYELTYLKKGYDKIAFTLPDVDSQLVSLSDPIYQGKVKIIQIFGTWCPNCRDETVFLSDYVKKLDNDNLKIIGLAYERRKDFEKASAIIKVYKEKLGIPYDILIAGTPDKESVSKTLPMLNHISSYPTLIFIDKNNKVRKIHTGFTGPATSQYGDYVKNFDTLVQKLMNEIE